MFEGKSLKICSRSILIFCCLTFGFFFEFISFVEKKINSTIEQQNCKGHEKRDRLLVSKVLNNHQISSRLIVSKVLNNHQISSRLIVSKVLINHQISSGIKSLPIDQDFPT